MQTRQNVLHQWLEKTYPAIPFTLTPLSGDASFRRYFRLEINHQKWMVMDAPPEKEPLSPFITICKILREHSIHAPAIEKVEFDLGFAILEDFGDVLLLKKLQPTNADYFYKKAMDILLQIQACPTASIPAFNAAYMEGELSLFKDWFLEKYLSLNLNGKDKDLLDQYFSHLITTINAQPKTFIHRDYHSRNLMIIHEAPLELGVIDFQDAMWGPITYDLVSLLKDCYIQWPRQQTLEWVNYFYSHLDIPLSPEEFIKAFDYCGLQRHLKVLGIFCRLHFRDNKSSYLKDLPLVFNYVMACLETYAELNPLLRLMQDQIYPAFLEKRRLL
ncbi:putative phosphotransferase (plasmid) [Legionella adelaidensis]|uniref:Putative phosphotransferase n=1 Tax=Legionella adelaidensis TaxID=45056 RepID=A0A0W0R1C0_9GAMM|nr:phosphotransferase [Legionella adelaidensis]KTC64896.1 putative phosphotransferase [Legionella adelaidensis]VEH82933.1 putative phosphotransferase [Legionella adelaidensis]